MEMKFCPRYATRRCSSPLLPPPSSLPSPLVRSDRTAPTLGTLNLLAIDVLRLPAHPAEVFLLFFVLCKKQRIFILEITQKRSHKTTVVRHRQSGPPPELDQRRTVDDISFPYLSDIFYSTNQHSDLSHFHCTFRSSADHFYHFYHFFLSLALHLPYKSVLVRFSNPEMW